MSENRKVALQIRNQEPWQDTARAMAKYGFRYVSMAFGDEKPLLRDDWREYVENIKRTLEDMGLRCVMTHAPYYHLLISAECRDPDMELALLRTVEATKILEAEICAVHPRSYITAGAPRESACDRARSLEENLIAFRPLVAACETHGVKLGIENLMRYPYEHPYFYSYIVEDQCELIDRLESESVCAIWDFGHANLVDEDHADRIRRLGARIQGTHVHNNDGIQDNHFPPFLPPRDAYYVRRTVDWESVMHALADTGYDGYLTLESVFEYEYPTDSYIHYLYESIESLDRMLQKYKA